MKKILILSLILNFVVGAILGFMISNIITANSIEIKSINGESGMVQVKCLGQEFNYYYE